MASVASAAIIEGSLIIGLDDGSIINCGFVQGPQGLKGDPGPMGATGDPGLDGNTIHTVAGTPRNDMGRDGDYAIDNINWRIYGPKSGGVWGKAKEMLPGPENIIENGRNTGAATGGGGAGSGGGSGDGSATVFTTTVVATGSGRLVESGTGARRDVSYPGSPNGIIAPENGMGVQANINGFLVRALEELEVEIPVYISEDKPTAGLYDGKLWFDSSEDEATLYIRYTDPDGKTEWMPAAPPVSLEGIEQSLFTLTEKIQVVETGVVGARVDIAGNAGEIEQVKTRLDTLESAEPPEIPDVDLSGLVEKDGDTMTGTLQINGSLETTIDPLLCRADGYYMSFGVTKEGTVFAGRATSNPFMAVDNWDVVTKGYLTTQLATPAQIAETNLGRRFKLGSWNDVVNSDGEPGWLDIGVGTGENSNWVAMSLTDLDGLTVHHSCDVADFNYGTEMPFTIYTQVNDEWKVIAGGKTNAQTDCKSDYFQLSKVTWGRSYSSIDNRNQIVRIKVGGLW